MAQSLEQADEPRRIRPFQRSAHLVPVLYAPELVTVVPMPCVRCGQPGYAPAAGTGPVPDSGSGSGSGFCSGSGSGSDVASGSGADPVCTPARAPTPFRAPPPALTPFRVPARVLTPFSGSGSGADPFSGSAAGAGPVSGSGAGRRCRFMDGGVPDAAEARGARRLGPPAQVVAAPDRRLPGGRRRACHPAGRNGSGPSTAPTPPSTPRPRGLRPPTPSGSPPTSALPRATGSGRTSCCSCSGS